MIPVLVFGRGETRQQASQTIGGAKRRRTKASVDVAREAQAVEEQKATSEPTLTVDPDA